MTQELARRHFIKQMGLLGAGIAATAIPSAQAKSPSPTGNEALHTEIPFFGTHQAGIETLAQRHIYFLVLDLDTQEINAVREMFKTWTRYAIQLTQGKFVQPQSDNAYLPPSDTGEAASLNPHNLTLTFGVSPSFFEKLNITHLKPEEFTDLPHFPRDQLQAQYVGGDICIQACADDPQVAFHAVRNLVRAVRTQVTLKWSQAGFNSYDNPKDTPRNLFGFRDGTANKSGEELAHYLWCAKDNWLKEGSYLVVRRIKMFLETWDRTSLAEQENTFGRYRASGAPMGQKAEFDTVDLGKQNEKGEPAIPVDSHVHLANRTGIQIHRRSYSYASGIDSNGQFDSGLLFISFQRHPQRFIQLQNMLGNVDKLNEYITHIGSGIFACFPGVQDEHDYLGKALFSQI